VSRVILENVGKLFGATVAVSDFSLEIRDTEFIVLVGPSGCGKSTTLRMVAGLEEPTSGVIRIGERDVTGVPPRDRNVAMVFQNYALYPHMDVYRNMGFGLMIRKLDKKEIDQRVKQAANILGITALLSRKPRQLSGGERQRVALGRAIVRAPEVFLFDEPLSNLDAKLRVHTRLELKKLHERLATTMIYVTHDQVEAMTLGDRIVVMKNSFVQQIGTPLEVYHNPINQFVAGFIGSPSMNFIEAHVVGEGNDLYVQGGDLKLMLPRDRETRYNTYLNRKVIFGIRPEDIHGAPIFSHSGEGVKLRAKVDVLEAMGSEFIAYMIMDNTGFIARFPSHMNISHKQEMDLFFNMERAHLFDVATGLTI